MRRNLILLAVLLAGSGRAGTPEPTAPAGGVPAIAGLDLPDRALFVRSAAAPLPPVWQEGSGPAPRPLSRRLDVLVDEWLRRSASALQARFEARSAMHRAYAAPSALDRAGRFSFAAATPPPFRFV